MATRTETCYRHPNRETGVSCSNCGRPICPDCMTPTPVGMRCPECSKQTTQVRTIRTMSAQPTVTMALLAVNVIAFLVSGQFGAGTGASANQVFNRGALDGYAIHVSHEYYRLVTSGFLHAGFIHLAFNMYLLYVLGQMLEPAIGHVRFAVIYGVALVGGSAGALLVQPDALTVGASGAIFGLMGAAFFELRERGVDPFQAGIGGLILINLAFSFVLANISIGGHIGGLIAGSCAALAFHQADRRGQPWLGFVAAGLLALGSVAAALAAAGQAHGFI